MNMPLSSDGHRMELERRAEEARARLAETLAELDRRRQEWFDVGAQLHRHTREFARAGGLGLGSIAVLSAIALLRAARRDRRKRAERAHAIVRFWNHPDRLARRRRSGLLVMIMSVGASVVAVAAMQLAESIIARSRPRLAPP